MTFPESHRGPDRSIIKQKSDERKDEPMKRIQKQSSFCLRFIVLLLTVAVSCLGLYAVNESRPRVLEKNGEYVLREEELERAVFLLENAVRHSPEGGEILLSAEEKEGKVCLAVTDEGEGMTESVQSHIFERGYSYHKDGGKSSGLGLNIALRIVKAHRGEIQVWSEVQKGSRFEIRLPHRQETDD